MLTDAEVRKAASSHLSDDELRMLVDAELGGNAPELRDIRLKLAADLLCDAAMEVASVKFGAQKISKVFVHGTVQIGFSDLAIVTNIDCNVENGKITQDEINALLLKSSVAHVVSQAIEDGVSPEEIASGEIQTRSLRLAALERPRKKGLISRLFDRD